MVQTSLAHWMLEQEARALLRRVDRVKPFSLQETMVPAAGLMPASLIAIERYLMEGRRRLRGQLVEYIRWIQGPGRAAEPVAAQRRYMVLRLGLNTALAQLDLFAEAVTQRSESEVGVWLSGLDVAAQDALALPGAEYAAPPIICYLHRGLGGAIRRARTRLPGGGDSPASIIRIPRERMIGFGVASSLVHEVGHQAAALLDLVPSLRIALQRRRQGLAPEQQSIWRMWERWISEIIADFWAVGRVGIASTLGLIGIVTLPRPFVFRIALDDPHPFPWIRVELSCAIGRALYPHVQWDQLARTWEAFYPLPRVGSRERKIVDELQRTIPQLVDLLSRHQPDGLRGRTLGESVATPDRVPEQLTQTFRLWRRQPAMMRAAPPTLVFAVFARARITGLLTPEAEDRMLARLITHWALKSTLDIATICATPPAPKPAITVPAPRQPQLVAAS